MITVRSNVDEVEAKTSRRLNRRRSSRISKSSAKAIRNVVAKLSGDHARQPLVKTDSEDDDSTLGISESLRELDSAGGASACSTDDTKSVGTSTMSLSELRPREPVHVDISNPEAATPSKKTLRRPSGDGGSGYPNDSSGPLDKSLPSTLNDSNNSILGSGRTSGEGASEELKDSSTSNLSLAFRTKKNRSSSDLMDLAKAGGLLDESELEGWDDASAISGSIHQLPLSRASSLGMMSATEDTDSVDEVNEGQDTTPPTGALQFLPPELNTLLNISPEHPPGKIAVPEMLPPKFVMGPISDTEVFLKKPEGMSAKESKHRRSSKSEKPKRRRSTVNHGDSVRSTRTSGSKARDDGRRSTRSERRSSVQVTGTPKTVRRRTSGVEMKDTSIRRRSAGESKETSSRRRSTALTKETSFRRRVSAETKDTSSRRRTSAETADGSERRSRHVESSLRKSKHSSGHDKLESSARRSRRTVPDLSKSRQSSCRELKDSNDGANEGRRGPSDRPKSRKLDTEATSAKTLIREDSYRLPSEVPEDQRHPVLRSFSSVYDEATIAITEKEAPAGETTVETTGGKRLSRRNSSAALTTGNKEPKRSLRRSSSRESPHGDMVNGKKTNRRNLARSPNRSSHRRRSVSCTPAQKKELVESLALPSPPTVSRRKMNLDEHRPRQGENKRKGAQRRHPSGDREEAGKDPHIVQPLQLVFESISAESNHTVLSCQKASFPAHSTYADKERFNESQRSARSTAAKFNKEDSERLNESQRSLRLPTSKANREDLLKSTKGEAWSRSYSNLLRAPKQLKHQKPNSRTDVCNESLVIF